MSNLDRLQISLLCIQCTVIVFSIYSVERTIKKNNKEIIAKMDELNNTIKELESKLEKK